MQKDENIRSSPNSSNAMLGEGMGSLKVLIGCEYSGTVRDAFTALGHDAISCDFLPSETPGKHYQGDVMDIINDGFDLGIFFTPCTYSCNSGVRWFYNADGSINEERFEGCKKYAIKI